MALIVALSWNALLNKAFDMIYGDHKNSLVSELMYAIVATALTVAVILAIQLCIPEVDVVGLLK